MRRHRLRFLVPAVAMFQSLGNCSRNDRLIFGEKINSLFPDRLLLNANASLVDYGCLRGGLRSETYYMEITGGGGKYIPTSTLVCQPRGANNCIVSMMVKDNGSLIRMTV